jgi:acetylornithine deacetylase/succinyl-diaminopimelate desuccinylase-like protein
MLTSVDAAGRVLDRLDRLYALGGGRGANRVGYSEAEDEAHELVTRWMEEAGLEIERDAAGNLLGRLRGTRPALPEVWTGSHLDSVPEGGRFDGALGVVGGLEAVVRAGRGERTLAVVAFRDEERGCSGSRARAAGAMLPGAFVEFHVEQGPRLADAGVPLGVVAGIVGYVRGEVVFDGRPGHAGTTPMDGRGDALCAAAEFVLRTREAARRIPDAVATVGRLEVEPGGANVIPGRVRVSIDARAPDSERLDRLVSALDLDSGRRTEPVAFDAELRSLLRAELVRRGLSDAELVSGAGHDAGILASAGVPAAMLFVRSLAGGVSHAPEEESSGEDIALGLDVLAGALRRLAA